MKVAHGSTLGKYSEYSNIYTYFVLCAIVIYANGLFE